MISLRAELLRQGPVILRTNARSDSRTIWRVGRKEREDIVVVLFVGGGRKWTRIYGGGKRV